MQINLHDDKVLEGVKLLCGTLPAADTLRQTAPRGLFDEMVCAFLEELSAALLRDKNVRAYPDVVAFAFFCRKANLAALAKNYEQEAKRRVGRGLLFHIAPSNVPINFAYTLVQGLLSGNLNIVKASSKGFAQTGIVCAAISALLAEERFAVLRPFVCVVEYDRNRQDVTEYFSSLCSARLIWGGNATIEAVRRAPLAPRAFDVTFADRYSLAVLDAEAVLAQNEQDGLKRLAQDFYNDTYLFDQNACTSPRLVYWLGESEQVKKAQELFWMAVHENIRERYHVEPVVAVDKLTAMYRSAIDLADSHFMPMPDNRVNRVEISKLSPALPDYRAVGGLFHEYVDTDLEALAEIVDERYKALSYFGCDKQALRDFVVSHGLRGIDNIAPVGKAADMDLIWDGYDLMLTLSRIIAVG